MLRRISASLVVVSVVLATTSSMLAVPAHTQQSKVLDSSIHVSLRFGPHAQGSKVFMAPMGDFAPYFRAAAREVSLPLVFVRTRAEAEYEVTGTTKQVPSDEAENVANFQTTRQETTVRVTRVDSGREVFQHSVRTLVRSPTDKAMIVHWSTRSQAPNSLLAIGKQTAARRCVQSLHDALAGD